MLDELGVEADHRHSRSLSPLLHDERDEHRDRAIYGYWGSSVNVTDGEFLPYTESPVWCWSTYATGRHDDPMLFDVSADPEQEDDLAGEGREEEDRMRSLLVDALDFLDAPASQYERLALIR